jgi:3-hydroxybutyryl-CoA dehydratase
MGRLTEADGAASTPPASIAVGARRISERDIDAYASLTRDYNPIHIDPQFAAQTRFGRTIVYGTLVLVPIWEALDAMLGSRSLEGARAATQFLQPIKVGSVAHIEGRLAEANSCGIRYEFSITDEDGKHAVNVLVVIPRGTR